MISNFWHLPINPILKIQSFPLSTLILRQKSFEFCTPAWKLHNPYCHSMYSDLAINEMPESEIFNICTLLCKISPTHKHATLCTCQLLRYTLYKTVSKLQNSQCFFSWLFEMTKLSLTCAAFPTKFWNSILLHTVKSLVLIHLI